MSADVIARGRSAAAGSTEWAHAENRAEHTGTSDTARAQRPELQELDQQCVSSKREAACLAQVVQCSTDMRIKSFVVSIALLLSTPTISSAKDTAPPSPGGGANSTCKYCKCDVTVFPGGASIVNCGCAVGVPFLGMGYRKCERIVAGTQTSCDLTDLGKCSAPDGGGGGVIG